MVYFGVINVVQVQGCWFSDDIIVLGLCDVVKYVMWYVVVMCCELFDVVIELLCQCYGCMELVCVDQCLVIYLYELFVFLFDLWQCLLFLYFLGVLSQLFYLCECFFEYVWLEVVVGMICEELFVVLVSVDDLLVLFLGVLLVEVMVVNLFGVIGVDMVVWDVFFFYCYGECYDVYCVCCLYISVLFDMLLLVCICDYVLEMFYLVLCFGIYILFYCGVINMWLVMYFLLIVLLDCVLCVGGQIYVWEEGCCVMFDDIFEYEVWNYSVQIWVVLILDSWNFDLIEVEWLVVIDLVVVIGDFNCLGLQCDVVFVVVFWYLLVDLFLLVYLRCLKKQELEGNLFYWGEYMKYDLNCLLLVVCMVLCVGIFLVVGVVQV